MRHTFATMTEIRSEIIIENDIIVCCIRAESFPGGVLAAHQQLHRLIPQKPGRNYYGISYPDVNRKILYKAAVNMLNYDEPDKLNCETDVIRKGKYYGTVLTDFMQNIPAIGNTFEQLLKHPDLDPDGYCLEIYINNTDVQLLVKLI